MSLTANLRKDVAATEGQPDYSAVELLWNVLVKAAHIDPSPEEFVRILTLAKNLTPAEVAVILDDEAVNTLLNLQPPLETVLTDPHERLQTQTAAKEIALIKASRKTHPDVCLVALLGILKRIRNKRIHGFKTPDGPRDAEILGAARQLLRLLCNNLIA